MAEKLTIADLHQMKRQGKKIVAAVGQDYQFAQILDRAGVDIVSVGDSLGRRMLGQPTHHEVTVDQMVLFCSAVSRGVKRAVVNCDMPFGPPQAGPGPAVDAAIRLVKEGHAEMVKIDGGSEFPEVVHAIARAGIPVWAQFGFTPQTSMAIGDFTARTEEMVQQRREKIVKDAQALEQAGAMALDLTGVGPEVSREVVKAVGIPVIGHDAECDGRVTVGYAIVGYSADGIDTDRPGRVNTARIMFEGIQKFIADTRAEGH